jgi:hypothetical protein
MSKEMRCSFKKTKEMRCYKLKRYVPKRFYLFLFLRKIMIVSLIDEGL